MADYLVLPDPLRQTGLLETILQDGLTQLHLPVDIYRLEKLLAYVDLMLRWNRVHNLTAIRDPQSMISHHLLDSLGANSFLAGDSIVDVGSGAGLPGIPLAIFNQQRHFVLVDSSLKRIRFLRQVVLDLHLENVQIVRVRVESYRPSEAFDTVISRAFASLRQFVNCSAGLAAKTGRLLAMKSRLSDHEIMQLSERAKVIAIRELRIPGVTAKRYIVHLEIVATPSSPVVS